MLCNQPLGIHFYLFHSPSTYSTHSLYFPHLLPSHSSDSTTEYDLFPVLLSTGEYLVLYEYHYNSLLVIHLPSLHFPASSNETGQVSIQHVKLPSIFPPSSILSTPPSCQFTCFGPRSFSLFSRNYNELLFFSIPRSSDNRSSFNLLYSQFSFQFNIYNMNAIYPHRAFLYSQQAAEYFDCFMFHHPSHLPVSNSTFQPDLHGFPTHFIVKPVHFSYKNIKNPNFPLISDSFPSRLSPSLSGILRTASDPSKHIKNQYEQQESLFIQSINENSSAPAPNEFLQIFAMKNCYAGIHFGYPLDYNHPNSLKYGMDDILFTSAVFPKSSRTSPRAKYAMIGKDLFVSDGRSIEIINIANSNLKKIEMLDYSVDASVTSITAFSNGTVMILHQNGFIRMYVFDADHLESQILSTSDDVQVKNESLRKELYVFRILNFFFFKKIGKVDVSMSVTKCHLVRHLVTVHLLEVFSLV